MDKSNSTSPKHAFPDTPSRMTLTHEVVLGSATYERHLHDAVDLRKTQGTHLPMLTEHVSWFRIRSGERKGRRVLHVPSAPGRHPMSHTVLRSVHLSHHSTTLSTMHTHTQTIHTNAFRLQQYSSGSNFLLPIGIGAEFQRACSP